MEGMFNPLSILLHVVNAAILIFALYKLLYKPVRRYMNRRSEGVAKELQDVTDAQDQLKRDREQAQLDTARLPGKNKAGCNEDDH